MRRLPRLAVHQTRSGHAGVVLSLSILVLALIAGMALLALGVLLSAALLLPAAVLAGFGLYGRLRAWWRDHSAGPPPSLPIEEPDPPRPVVTTRPPRQPPGLSSCAAGDRRSPSLRFA